MRKNLLFVLGIIATISVFAQIPTNTIWSKSFTPITANLKMPNNQVMAVDASGAAIVTGTMMQGFTFAGKEVEALTQNASYIAKYSATGEELWAVAIDGGNINTITTDPNGNIYVAGSFKEAISLGTTTGEAIEKNGDEELDNVFFAKYDTEGAIAKAEIMIPEASFPDSWEGGPILQITQLAVTNDKIYVAIENYGANTKIGDITIQGTYNYEESWGTNRFCSSSYIISFTKDLVAEKIIATAGINENGSTTRGNAKSPKFAIDEDKLYFGVAGGGTVKVSSSTADQVFTYSTTEGEETVSYYGFIISVIDLNNGAMLAKNFESSYNGGHGAPLSSLSNIAINNQNIVIAGIYENEENPFNQQITKTGVTDMTIASLKENLDINWVLTSGYNEGTGTFTDFEELNSIAIFGNTLDAMGTIYNYTPKPENKKYISNTYMISVNLANGTASAPVVTPTGTIINTGIAGNGKNLLSASVTPSESKVTFTMAGEMPSAIGEVGANVSSTIISTLVTNEIQLSEIADVTVTNLAGIVIKKEKGVDQINVSDLSSGFYFVTINGVTTKIQKI